MTRRRDMVNVNRIGENMNNDDNDERQTMKNTKTLDNYLGHHPPCAAFQSLNISFGTLDALENAEKLVKDAKRTIIEASYSIPTFNFVTERQSTTDIDDNESYIRDIVTARFEKVNRQMSSSSTTIPSLDKKSSVEINSPPRVQRIISREPIERGRVRYHETKRKIKSCKECLMSKDEKKLTGKKSLGTFHNKNSAARADIKPQLTLRNIETLDLLPDGINNKTPMNNVKTYVFKYGLSKRTSVDESLIDVGIQTSLCELSREEDNVTSNKLTELPVHIVKSSSVMRANQQQTIENSPMHPDDSRRINCEEKSSEEINKNESKGSFVDFLCRITELERIEDKKKLSKKNDGDKINSDDDTQLSEVDDEFYYDFDVKKIVLDPPDVGKFDEIMCGLDKKIEKVSKGIDKFFNEFFPLPVDKVNDAPINESFMNKNKNKSLVIAPEIIELPKKKNSNSQLLNDEDTSSDEQTNVKFLMKPRSRISSSDSTESSETMLPPRFSTPLDDYQQIDVPATIIDVKNSCDTIGEFISITENDNIKETEPESFPIINKLSSTSVNINSTEIPKEIDVVSSDKNSSSITKNTEEKTPENIQSNTIPLVLSHKNQESSGNLKFKTDNIQTQLILDNNIDNEKNIEREINIIDHFSKVVINDVKSGLINNQDLENNEASQSANLITDDQNNSPKARDKSDIIILDKVNPISSELSIRDRTSLDASVIYSESFEVSSAGELKSTSKITQDENKSIILIDENTKINSASENTAVVIDNTKIIKNSIEEKSHDSKENKKNISHSQLSENFNFNYRKPNEKIESDRNTISISSSSSTSSLKKVSINSASSAQTSNEIKLKLSADDCYSEGEFYLPSCSCSYSLGEIKIPKCEQSSNNINNYDKTKCRISHVSLNSNSPPTQSPGQILETDIESNISIEN